LSELEKKAADYKLTAIPQIFVEEWYEKNAPLPRIICLCY
jgi:hypothetical protein